MPPVTPPRIEVEVVMDDLETQLVESAKLGEPSAGPFLVSYCGERLLGYAHSHAPDLSDPDRERIVEMAIEAGVRAIGQFDPTKGSLLGWFRTQIRYKTLEWRRSNPTPYALDREVVAPGIAPPTIVDEATEEALRRAISRLEPADQLILALRDVEQLPYREIADRLRITNEVARQRHVRAIRRLRQQVRDEPGLSKFGAGVAHG